MGPLSDLVVLDFSTLLPGPLATLILAEAGADVIKVERPGSGEDMRSYDPAWGNDGATFAVLNRGKQSVELDLKSSDALNLLRPVIKSADILVEQFRPGVMDRLGLGYQVVSAINPKIIYCSISAYGQSGPKRDAVGHDINVYAESGLLMLSMSDPSDPVMPPAPFADIGAGSYPAVMNILIALHERNRTGAGRHLDIALADNLFTFGYWALAQGTATGAFPNNRDHLVTGASPRYRLYATSDKKIVAAAPLEPKFWANFCRLIDLDTELRDDSVDPVATIARITAIISSQSAQFWAERFATEDCCCSVARSLDEAMNDPHFSARRVFSRQISNERGNFIPALPLPLDPAYRVASGDITAAPVLGANNSILGERSFAEVADANKVGGQ